MNAQKGYVLILVLVAVLLIAGLSTLAIRQSLTDVRHTFAKTTADELFVMADAPLSLLRKPAVKERLMQDGGIIDVLMTRHYSMDNDNTTPRTSVQLCYDAGQGVDNFVSSGLAVAGRTSCSHEQAWLWLSVQPIQPSDAPSVTKEPSNTYRIAVHSLATEQMTGCLGTPETVMACLDKQGIAHQMLVQEYVYQRIKTIQDDTNHTPQPPNTPIDAIDGTHQNTQYHQPSERLIFDRWYDVRNVGQGDDE
ncbi:MAG: hypothetical protein Q4B81_01590 [Moraxella sp.]|nr:hypothetical protein [Moraxella sp.]